MTHVERFAVLPRTEPRRRLLWAGLLAWATVGLCAGLVFLLHIGNSGQSSRFYILPWCFGTGIVIVLPSVYLLAKGRFHPFHPLVVPVWTYFFPAFFVGGLIVAFSTEQSYIMSLIQDETTAIPLTFVYVMLGFGFMSLGFSVSFARGAGRWISGRLPHWEISSRKVLFPGVILILLGGVTNLARFALGIFGFQYADEVGVLDGILYLLSLFLIEGSVLLWLYVFRSERFAMRQMFVAATLLIITVTLSAFQGNRGSLLQGFILIAFAFSFSGRKITVKHYAVGAICATLAILVGMVYGTTFRNIKGTRDRISVDEYAAIVPSTLGQLSEQNPSTFFGDGLSYFTGRLDSVGSLAVVVSNYEMLAPYEETWGINDNIYVDTVIFFIPRVLWPNKPVPIDPSRYGDLYFNYAENSFAMTPMGDLLRNFGPIGIPIGMFLLGFLIRVIYSSLVENHVFSYLRLALFYMLLSNISFEGTFSLIIPTLFKVGVFAVLGLILVRFIVGPLEKKV